MDRRDLAEPRRSSPLELRRSLQQHVLAGEVRVEHGADREPVPVQPNLEDLLRAETDDDAEEALSLADFDDEQ